MEGMTDGWDEPTSYGYDFAGHGLRIFARNSGMFYLQATNESMRGRLLWVEVVMMCIVMLMGLWQIQYLKRYFQVRTASMRAARCPRLAPVAGADDAALLTVGCSPRPLCQSLFARLSSSVHCHIIQVKKLI